MFLQVLHPRHKLEYFKKQKWEDMWIEDAHDIVRHTFDHSYMPAHVQDQSDAVPVASSSSVSFSFASFPCST